MKFLLPLLVIVLSACASRPLKFVGVNEGHWKGKALIKDKEQGRSYIVYLNMNAKRDEAVRMDVTSTLGTGVAVLVASDKEVRYMLFDSKRFYFGTPREEVMRPILALPFDPRWLLNVLFEEPLPSKTWTCKSSGGWLEECRDAQSGVKISWASRQGAKRNIFIEHTKASVQMNIESFEPKVEDRKNLFELEAPSGWQKLRVR